MHRDNGQELDDDDWLIDWLIDDVDVGTPRAAPGTIANLNGRESASAVIVISFHDEHIPMHFFL